MKLFRVHSNKFLSHLGDFGKYHFFRIGQLVTPTGVDKQSASAEYRNRAGNEQFVPKKMLRRVKCTKENLRKFHKDMRSCDWSQV